jgi:glycosyltransferase involved in cell wall biosynthesis
MKVLFILPNLAAGGVQRQWSILLPGLRDRGIDARMVALDGGGPFASQLQIRGVPLEVLDMRHQVDAVRMLRSGLLRHFAPDVVVTQSVSGLYVGLLVAKLRGAVNVFNDHRQVGLALTPRREAMVRLIARQIDWVIAVSEEQKAAWLDRRYPPERIVVIANGVEIPSVAASRTALREALGLPTDAVAALLVATLRPEKRAKDFVTAVSAARRTNPDIIGMVCGDGPERAAVDAAAAGERGIRVLGHRDDVSALMKAADIFVLASEHEAVPMAILEAMASGLPVVATSVGDIPAVVTDGESGWLVEPGDVDAMASRLVDLAADRDLRAGMGAVGERRWRDGWDATRMVDGYAGFLAGLVR